MAFAAEVAMVPTHGMPRHLPRRAMESYATLCAAMVCHGWDHDHATQTPKSVES